MELLDLLLLVLAMVMARACWRVMGGVMDGLAGRAPRGRGGNVPGRSVQMVRDPVCGTYVIPDRAIVLGVASRTTLAITGATSYGVGIVGNTTQFGNLLGAALNSTNNGVIGPTAFYADTKVRVTANGGNFTAGKVRLTIYFLEMSVPSS